MRSEKIDARYFNQNWTAKQGKALLALIKLLDKLKIKHKVRRFKMNQMDYIGDKYLVELEV